MSNKPKMELSNVQLIKEIQNFQLAMTKMQRIRQRILFRP